LFQLNVFPHYWTLWWRPWRGAACPHCGQTRPWRAPLLEFVMIGLFVSSGYWLAGDWRKLLVVWLYTAFLLTVLVIDLEQRRVLNIMLAPASLAVLLLSFGLGTPDPFHALAGGAIGFGFFLLL